MTDREETCDAWREADGTAFRSAASEAFATRPAEIHATRPDAGESHATGVVGAELDARRCAVLGSPIAHSLSPTLHMAAYRALGLDGWKYERREVTADGLGDFLHSLTPEWAGLSLTMPLKRTIGRYGTPMDRWSSVLGVANTAVFDWVSDGRVPGIRLYNTDVTGIVRALREAYAGTAPSQGGSTTQDLPLDTANVTSATLAAPTITSATTVPGGKVRPRSGAYPRWTPSEAVIIGNGNTAASAVAAMGELGVRHAYIIARHPEHGMDPLRAAASEGGVRLDVTTFDHAPERLRDADIVVSTIPAHAADALASRLAGSIGSHGGASPFTPHGILLDVVYDPRPSLLLRAWASSGGVAVGGESMLLWQAVSQVSLMTGAVEDADWTGAMRVALKEAL